MAETTVHLLRHGEVHNPEGLLYGRLPGYRLSALGREMAERVAAHFVERAADLGLVVASPLERAQETAEPTATKFGLEVHTDDRLIESGNYFEGMAFGVGDGSLRRPRHWWHLRNPLQPSWGEPYLAIATRMLTAAQDAAEHAAGREVLLVSHQLPIWTLRSFLEGRRLWHDPRRRECSLASLTTVKFRGREVIGLEYSEPCADLLPGASKVAGA